MNTESNTPKSSSKNGFAALFLVVVLLAALISLAAAITFLTVTERRISRNITYSTQAYYAAEAGLEDAILRLKKGWNWQSSYNLNCGGSPVTVVISDIIGGSRTITATGTLLNLARKVQTVYEISTTESSFYYGAQVGVGGMEMGNNSRIKGNVFSNGSVVAPTDRGFIDNTVIVATNGNYIEGLQVGGNAFAYSCLGSKTEITGDLTYVSGGSAGDCQVDGVINVQAEEIEPRPLPISSSQIDGWKSDAAESEILGTDYTLDDPAGFLGPIQIGTLLQPRNLTVDIGSRLTVTGTIYVTGDILFRNNAIIELDEGSYGSTSGVIIADGKIIIENGCQMQGSGQVGSYVLILSTNGSLDPASPALLVSNNAQGAIFYTSSGLVMLENGMKAREITGYQVQIEETAEIEYESGLESVIFSSGPGGSWQVAGWKEIE